MPPRDPATPSPPRVVGKLAGFVFRLQNKTSHDFSLIQRVGLAQMKHGGRVGLCKLDFFPSRLVLLRAGNPRYNLDAMLTATNNPA